MRYQLVQLAQLGLSLLLIFGAFLGGVALGWWRWGRSDANRSPDAVVSVASASLFTPEVREDEVVLAEVTDDFLRSGDYARSGGNQAPLFAAASTVDGMREPAALPSPPQPQQGPYD